MKQQQLGEGGGGCCCVAARVTSRPTLRVCVRVVCVCHCVGQRPVTLLRAGSKTVGPPLEYSRKARDTARRFKR